MGNVNVRFLMLSGLVLCASFGCRTRNMSTPQSDPDLSRDVTGLDDKKTLLIMSLGDVLKRDLYDCWVELPISVSGRTVSVNMEEPIFLVDRFVRRKMFFHEFEEFSTFRENVKGGKGDTGIYYNVNNERENAARRNSLMSLLAGAALSAVASTTGAPVPLLLLIPLATVGGATAAETWKIEARAPKFLMDEIKNSEAFLSAGLVRPTRDRDSIALLPKDLMNFVRVALRATAEKPKSTLSVSAEPLSSWIDEGEDWDGTGTSGVSTQTAGTKQDIYSCSGHYRQMNFPNTFTFQIR